MDDAQGIEHDDENDAITYTLESLAEFDDKALDEYFSLKDELFERTSAMVNPVQGRSVGLQYIDFRESTAYKSYEDYFQNFVSYLPSDEYLYVKQKKFSIFTGFCMDGKMALILMIWEQKLMMFSLNLSSLDESITSMDSCH